MTRGIVCCLLLTSIGITLAVDPMPSRRAGGDSEARLLDRLSRSTEFDFDAIGLDEACEVISDEYGMPIVIDTTALEHVSLDESEVVSLRLNGVTLRSALSIMLRPLGLTYAVKHEVLLITTADRARDNRFYNISQLSRAGISRDEIIDVCGAIGNDHAHASTSPMNGNPNGPKVRHGFCRIVGDGALLAVNATDQEHMVIASSLSAMQEALADHGNPNFDAEEEMDDGDLFGSDDPGCSDAAELFDDPTGSDDSPFADLGGDGGHDPFGSAEDDGVDDPFGDL